MSRVRVPSCAESAPPYFSDEEPPEGISSKRSRNSSKEGAGSAPKGAAAPKRSRYSSRRSRISSKRSRISSKKEPEQLQSKEPDQLQKEPPLQREPEQLHRREPGRLQKEPPLQREPDQLQRGSRIGSKRSLRSKKEPPLQRGGPAPKGAGSAPKKDSSKKEPVQLPLRCRVEVLVLLCCGPRPQTIVWSNTINNSLRNFWLKSKHIYNNSLEYFIHVFQSVCIASTLFVKVKQ